MLPLKMLVMSLTGRCNLACSYCYASEQDKSVMTWDTARRGIDIAAASGEKFVLQLSGGEPLLAFPLLQKIAAYIRENRIPARIQIQTNGTLVTDEIAMFLKTTRIAVGVSLDGRAALNDQQRKYSSGGGATADTVAGIRRLYEHDVAIGLTCVVTAGNVAKLSGIVEMAYYLGNVRRIGFDLLRGQGQGHRLVPAAPDAVDEAMAKVFARADEFARLTGRSIRFTQVEQAQSLAAGRRCGFAHCHAMNGEGAHLDAAGNFYACSSFVGDARFWIGDVAHGLDGDRQQETASHIQKCMEFCCACPDFADCGGGCFARWHGGGQRGPYLAECALKRVAMARAGAGVKAVSKC